MMKYVALLSGGKDSCFNLEHCALNGHELIAAASLGPSQGKEELDSYLYQTVGQDAIEYVAQALDVPLYRRCIVGSAVEQGSEYGTREGSSEAGVKGDETEDLYYLLSEVKVRHPDAQGVSVGAILSNYQRVRVENVCLRLSLTPLCYLWQRDQDELLSEMIASGVEAILIKVAGIGLKPKHLGQTLSAVQPTLKHLNELYGAHICGEGGEYETLSLDSSMFKRRIVLKDVETVIHSDNAFATVAYMRIKDAYLAPKESVSRQAVAAPPLLLPEFDRVRMLLDESGQELATPQSASSRDTVGQPRLPPSSCKVGNWVAIANIQQTERTIMSVGEELMTCLQSLKDRLSQYNLFISDLTFVNLLISDMSTFPEINQVYKSFFGTSPPARACVAVDLPPGVNVRLDCIAFDDQAHERRALHVQGLSYWAPANIGPYSQAIILDNRLFISGQIGMQPHDLALPNPRDFALETALAFQHVHRIITALKDTHGANWKDRIQSLIYWLVNPSDLPKARKTGALLQTYASVPTLLVGVKALPKGALIEAQVIAHTGQYIVVEDGEAEVRQCGPSVYDEGMIESESCIVFWKISALKETSSFCGILSVKGDPGLVAGQLKSRIKENEIWKQTFSVRCFCKGTPPKRVLTFVRSLFSDDAQPSITEIPVRFIATEKVHDWDFALCLVGGGSSGRK